MESGAGCPLPITTTKNVPTDARIRCDAVNARLDYYNNISHMCSEDSITYGDVNAGRDLIRVRVRFRVLCCVGNARVGEPGIMLRLCMNT